MMTYSQDPGNGLAELPHYHKLNVMKIFPPGPVTWEVRHLLKYAVQFSRHRDNEIHKI